MDVDTLPASLKSPFSPKFFQHSVALESLKKAWLTDLEVATG